MNASVDVSGGTISWTPADGLDNTNELDPLASPSVTTTYVLTYSIEECIETDTIIVEVSEDIVLDLVPEDTLCLGESIVLANDPMVQGATYSWTPVDGLDDPSSPTPTATPTQTTTYEVMAVNGACERMASVTIVVVPDILPEAGDDINICVGDQTQLDASVNLTGGIISWSPADGLSQTDILDPLANPTTTTTYFFTYTIEECSQTDSVVVEVSEDVVLNLTPDTDICLGDDIALANNPIIPGATYTWTPTTGLDDPNSANPTANPEQTTTYEVVAVNGACSDSATVTITVIRDLEVDAGDDVTICEGDIASLNAVGVNGSDYFWTPADGLSDPEVANPDASPTTTTTYTVQYFEGPCFVEDSVTVNVAGNFGLDVSNDTTIFQLDVVELSAVPIPVNDNPIGNINFSWESTTGLSEPTNPTTMASPLETITYTVTATSEFGCTATASVNVIVLEPTFGIPNAFSPNGDGLNDNFRIEVEGNINIMEFKIFDRWGELVFDNATPEGWMVVTKAS